MRRRGRRDENHAAVRDELRQLGFSVADLGDLGGGIPDLLVGTAGVNLLVEVKRPEGPRGGRSGRTLTEDQVAFVEGWRGPVAVATCVEDVVAALASLRLQRPEPLDLGTDPD